MAEPSRPPSLPSSSDAVPYVAISWMAVAALAASGLFVALLVVLGLGAWTSKRPLLNYELLYLAAIGLVLAFAARRTIRNSEGTKTGERLANAAWWTALVAGLGYGAYLLAIEYSVYRDARREVDRWTGYVLAGDTVQAFDRTLPPGGRLYPDEAAIRARFRDDLLAFENSDLAQVAGRNKGAVTFESGSLRDWAYAPGGVTCAFTGTLVCPEGRFAVVVPMKGVDGVTGAGGEAAGRQWKVDNAGQGGYLKRADRTPYGWKLLELEHQGASVGRAFLRDASAGPGGQIVAFRRFVRPDLGDGQAAVMAAAGVTAGAVTLPPDYVEFTRGPFFTLPGGKEPPADARSRFWLMWNTVGLSPAGSRLKGTVDTADTVAVTDRGVEVRVPVEIPLPGGSDGEPLVARGRLVVACDDPTVLANLKALRAEADPAKSASAPPAEFGKGAFLPWRVVRVESDMREVKVPRPGPDDGGPPGGMPGH